jgi:2-octaprenylphenol hydroxylase
VKRTDFHIAIVGGGPVGCVCALQLRQLGFAVTLLERQAPIITRGVLGVDIRNVSLSSASQEQLGAVGVWARLEPAAFTKMQVWEEWGTGEVTFDAAELGSKQLGWVVEMTPLNEALWQRLDEVGVVTRICSIDEVDVGLEGVTIRAAQGEVEADFVIGADGANSLVRQALDVPVIKSATHQVALATVVRTENEHRNTARQCFLQDGPLALLPTTIANVCSVVWSQSPQLGAQREAMSDQEFCADLARSFEHRLGDVTDVDQRVVFPLTQQRVKSCAPHARVLLIGDAMRVIHPLAGLGVNLGLEDVRGLVRTAETHTNLAAANIWRRFARQRQIRSAMMIQAMSSLQATYASATPAFGWLRNLGVDYVNERGWVKRQIMREAMGLGPVAQSM